jgi:hypothetical protein
LDVVHVLEEEDSGFVLPGFLLEFAAEFGEAYPDIGGYPFEVGEVYGGFVFSGEELNWFSIGKFFIFRLQSEVSQQNVVLECLSKLFDLIRALGDERLETF